MVTIKVYTSLSRYGSRDYCRCENFKTVEEAQHAYDNPLKYFGVYLDSVGVVEMASETVYTTRRISARLDSGS